MLQFLPKKLEGKLAIGFIGYYPNTTNTIGFVLIGSGIPGDRGALYFLRERKPFFPHFFG
jgi:hypothetical protein